MLVLPQAAQIPLVPLTPKDGHAAGGAWVGFWLLQSHTERLRPVFFSIKEKEQPNNKKGQKTLTDISPVKTHTWPAGT